MHQPYADIRRCEAFFWKKTNWKVQERTSMDAPIYARSYWNGEKMRFDFNPTPQKLEKNGKLGKLCIIYAGIRLSMPLEGVSVSAVTYWNALIWFRTLCVYFKIWNYGNTNTRCSTLQEDFRSFQEGVWNQSHAQFQIILYQTSCQLLGNHDLDRQSGIRNQ